MKEVVKQIQEKYLKKPKYRNGPQKHLNIFKHNNPIQDEYDEGRKSEKFCFIPKGQEWEQLSAVNLRVRNLLKEQEKIYGVSKDTSNYVISQDDDIITTLDHKGLSIKTDEINIILSTYSDELYNYTDAEAYPTEKENNLDVDEQFTFWSAGPYNSVLRTTEKSFKQATDKLNGVLDIIEPMLKKVNSDGQITYCEYPEIICRVFEGMRENSVKSNKYTP
jgi:hypothetical protein